MPAISAHLVRKPRKHWRCERDECREPLTGPHVVVFGNAFRTDPPYRIRLCVDCAWNADEWTVSKVCLEAWRDERSAG